MKKPHTYRALRKARDCLFFGDSNGRYAFSAPWYYIQACVNKVPVPAHQALPLTGYIFEAS